MTTFLAIYRGRSIREANIVAVTTEPDLVRDVAQQMLHSGKIDSDPVLNALQGGRKSALETIVDITRENSRR